MNYYEILEVSLEATEEQIKKAYRRKAVEGHPDKWPLDLSVEEKKEREKNWNLLQRAYEVLRDPSKRATYDVRGDQSASSLLIGGDLLENLLAETRTHQFGVAGLAKASGVLDRLVVETEYLEDVETSLKLSIASLQRREKLYREALAYLTLDEVEKQIVQEEIRSSTYGQDFLKLEMNSLKLKLQAFEIAQETQGVTNWDFLTRIFDEE